MVTYLYIEFEDRKYDLQTKRFECLLHNYYVGDFIKGGEAGLNIYFDTLNLDAQGKVSYKNNDIVHKKTIFVVICNAVFVDYLVSDYLETEALRKPIKKQLIDTWQNTYHLINFLSLQLAHKQDRIKHLSGLLYEAGEIANCGLNPPVPNQTQTQGKQLLNYVSESEQRIIAGEDPLQLIVACLAKKEINLSDDPFIDENADQL